MPLKNFHLKFLRKSIASVCEQTCPLWTLLIVVEKADLSYFKNILQSELNDGRIRLIGNEGRKLAGALNTGMKHALTDFVAILLSDDLWSTKAVEVLTEHIERFPTVDFFHSSRQVIDEDDRTISPIYLSKEEFTLNDFVFSPPVKHLLCWRREMALDFGGMDESLNSVGPDDFDFPWLMAEWGAQFMAIKDCLYLYRDHFQCYRLTTHLPLAVHVREITKIMRKHGVSARLIEAAVTAGKKSHLQQCVYRSNADKWIKDRLGHRPKQRWKYEYQ